MPIENTDLERRVLAHARILQALIRHMAESQPEILIRLKETFGRGHTLGADEQDYTSARQYGEAFIEAVEKAIQSGRDDR